MTDIFRPGAPLPYSELMELTRDGLLLRLTNRCWIRPGTVLDPVVRAQALGEPRLTGLVYSHRSAHWVWWGASSAPHTDELTTRVRRRLRSSHPGFTVWERHVPPQDEAALGGICLTTPERTLFDCVRDIALTNTGSQRTAAVVRLFSGIERHDAVDLARRVAQRRHVTGVGAVQAVLEAAGLN